MVETIQLGLRKGYYQNRQFRGQWEGFDNKITEYLLTVLVAVAINKTQGFGQINLEYPIWCYYQEAFPAYKWDWTDIFTSPVLQTRTFFRKRSKERIDIALSHNERGLANGLRSIHGVELKGIDKEEKDIIIDLRRLSDSMMSTDYGTMEDNSIRSCYMAFIRTCGAEERIMSDAELTLEKTRIVAEINGFLNKTLRKEYSALDYALFEESIDRESSESYMTGKLGIPELEVTEDDLKAGTGEVLGIVIEIIRK